MSVANKSDEDSDQVGRWLAEIALDSPDTTSMHILGWRLTPVSQRPPLGQYIKRTWNRRHFILADARARAFQSSRGTLLGRTWLVVSPFLNAMVYYLIFGVVLHTNRGIENFPAYLVIGVNFFAILRVSLASGSAVLTTKVSQNLMKSFSFPRISMVIAWSIRQFLDFLPSFVATIVFIIAMPPHELPRLEWLLIVPVVACGFVLALGIALVAGVLTSILPDLKFIWPLVSRFWFYASGVFFSINIMQDLPAIKPFMEVNPGYVFLSMSRDLLIYQTIPTLTSWIYLAAWAFLSLGIGVLLFWMREDSYGRQR